MHIAIVRSKSMIWWMGNGAKTPSLALNPYWDECNLFATVLLWNLGLLKTPTVPLLNAIYIFQ